MIIHFHYHVILFKCKIMQMDFMGDKLYLHILSHFSLKGFDTISFKRLVKYNIQITYRYIQYIKNGQMAN